MTVNRGTLKRKDVRRRFDRAALLFDEADFVHRATFAALIERLAPVVIGPSRILDLGAATGRGSRELAKAFRKSRVISCDWSGEMLRIARRKKPLLSKLAELQGDAMHIPLQTGSIDLVFANLLLPWIGDLPACVREIARVLKKGGVFAFATLGPDSLLELRAAWSVDDDYDHVNSFPDMHDVGDALVQGGLADPVLDIDRLAITYRDSNSLYRDLTASGARNSLANRRKTLTGKQRFDAVKRTLATGTDGGELSLTLELVYGHAWGTGPRARTGEYVVAPAEITRRQRPV
jgi:malonyl-CoA O-methyltransferase